MLSLIRWVLLMKIWSEGQIDPERKKGTSSPTRILWTHILTALVSVHYCWILGVVWTQSWTRTDSCGTYLLLFVSWNHFLFFYRSHYCMFVILSLVVINSLEWGNWDRLVRDWYERMIANVLRGRDNFADRRRQRQLTCCSIKC